MQASNRQRRYDCTTDPERGAIRRLVSALLGLLILSFNIFGGNVLPARAAQAGTAPFAQGLLEDRIVICTATGMVVVDRDGNIIETGAGTGHGDLCVFCLPLMHGGAQAPTSLAVIIVAQPAFVGEFSPAAPAPAKPVRLAGAAAPRAPPLA